MIQFVDLLLQDGTTIVLDSLAQQKFDANRLKSGLSDCDYEISFPNKLNRRCFMEGFCFTTDDYMAVREVDDPDSLSVAMLGQGVCRFYDLQQNQEDWWRNYRPQLQKICAEQLFGRSQDWKIWSLALSSLGVLLQYHSAHDVSHLGKFFVTGGSLMFDLHVQLRDEVMPKYRLEYANSHSQNNTSSTMRLRVFRENEILKEINITDYVPLTDNLIKV